MSCIKVKESFLCSQSRKEKAAEAAEISFRPVQISGPRLAFDPLETLCPPKELWHGLWKIEANLTVVPDLEHRVADKADGMWAGEAIWSLKLLSPPRASEQPH